MIMLWMMMILLWNKERAAVQYKAKLLASWCYAVISPSTSSPSCTAIYYPSLVILLLLLPYYMLVIQRESSTSLPPSTKWGELTLLLLLEDRHGLFSLANSNNSSRSSSSKYSFSVEASWALLVADRQTKTWIFIQKIINILCTTTTLCTTSVHWSSSTGFLIWFSA